MSNYASEWGYNDDAVYIPGSSEMSEEEKIARAKHSEEQKKIREDSYRSDAIRILQEIEKGGYDAFKVGFTNYCLEKTDFRGDHFINFAKAEIGGNYVSHHLFDDSTCNAVFGEDATQVMNIFKEMLAVKINKLINQGDIKGHSSVSTCNIGKVDVHHWTGLSIQIA